MPLTFIPYALQRAVGGPDTESSKLGFECSLSRRDQFTLFHHDGQFCMSNNDAEPELRAVAASRRN
ncbi:IS66 family transposase [Bradyrhizobium guangzhouense]|uniref:IS66 family transposase n=1 Tax=Bradyrhizobium guangzhouense TaxID=1325095 RepID=UPI001009BB6A|nr:hypothetical protein EAS54_32220 [Bradyrhizobium guangzhouense]